MWAGGAADGRMDSLHIPLTGSPWFRPLWAEVGHGAGDKPLFVAPLARTEFEGERVGNGGVAASHDGWLAGRWRWEPARCAA